MKTAHQTTVTGQAPDPGRICDYPVTDLKDPCTIVIFGASGDLTARKLVPALYNLHIHHSLPKPVSIVGCARTPMDHQEFRDMLEPACCSASPGAPSDPGRQWHEFSANLFYRPVAYDSEASFTELADFLAELDRARGTAGNRVFYLAIPPGLYPVVAEMIGRAGLAREGENNNGWSRIVVEKPFGRDLESAMSLDQTLHNSFTEKQIFRIDHYLAKETVQNILILRFANAIFEPVWNRSYIDYIGIIAGETLGVEHRAGYYEQAGVLRDMFQNHMMQLLAMTTMEPPSLFEANRVRDEKVKVYRSLKPMAGGTREANLILGQYGPGSIAGTAVPGYRDEPGVAPDSLTPTYALMRLYIDNWRWQGVPFYLMSGKRLAEKITRIVVQFKQVPHSMFKSILGEKISANRLILGIHPQEEITLTFQTKKPGVGVCLRQVTMDFKYTAPGTGPAPDAYEKVLLDCILGDHMLFWRQDGVELCWSFLSPILTECESCAGQENMLYPYAPGSWGPAQAKEWLDLILPDS